MAIPMEYVRSVCKPGQSDCCRYLCCGADGFGCLKQDLGNKAYIDGRVARNDFRARGDNCEGWEHVQRKEAASQIQLV
jgi:hypothetical protein